MNTKSLSKYYPALAAAERLSLILAALSREDHVEYTRLVETAPTVSFRGIHTVSRVIAFERICYLHRMQQLNLAALYFKAQSLADLSLIRVATDSNHKKNATSLQNTVRMYGYLVKIHGDGWVEFCERENLNPTIFGRVMSGDEVLDQADRDMRREGLTAFTTVEAQEYAKRSMGSDLILMTTELVAVSLQDLYKSLVASFE